MLIYMSNRKFSNETGVMINLDKSSGISLLSKEGMPSEFAKTKFSIDFLGYKLAVGKISIKESSINKIKQQISYLLYRNLIQPIRSLPLANTTIPSNDEDPAFVTAIMQIRRYLYGNLNDDIIKKYLNGTVRTLRFKGLMSFYPLIDDIDQLKQLDGWLVHTVLNCLKLRKKILLGYGYNIVGRFPFNLNKKTIIHQCSISLYKGKAGLTEIPSFLLIYKAIKKGLYDFGIDKIMNKDTNIYNYENDL